MNDIIIVTWGGLGDILNSTPTIRAIKESNPRKRIVIYCMNSMEVELFQNNPYVNALRILKLKHLIKRPKELFYYLFKRSTIKYYKLAFQAIAPSFLYSSHVKEIIPEIFSDIDFEIRDRRVQIFLSEDEKAYGERIKQSYECMVVIHVYSRSSINHQWPLQNWTELIRSMPNITFIQVGNVNEPLIDGASDLRGKTTLRQAFSIIRRADSFLGIDSLMAHVTNAFDVPGVVLFGDSSPGLWGHENNINLYSDWRCSPCYDYLQNNECPYGHECMTSITVEQVRSALKQQLSSRFPTAKLFKVH